MISNIEQLPGLNGNDDSLKAHTTCSKELFVFLMAPSEGERHPWGSELLLLFPSVPSPVTPLTVGGEEVACLLTQKPAASGTAAATARHANHRLGKTQGARPCPRPLRMLRRRLLLGISPHQWALEVDHIMPRNQSRSDDLSNLQALASTAMPTSVGRREAGCGLCALEDSGRVLLGNELALCIADA